MKKTVVIDTFSVGGFHEMFNASFLYVILNSTTGPVNYIADRTAIQAITLLLKNNNQLGDLLERVIFLDKTLPKGLSFYAIFFRYLYGTLLNIFYLFKFRSSKVIFPALNPLFGIFLKQLVKILKTDTYVVCHGELGYLFSRYSLLSPLFWYSAFLRPFFSGTLPSTLKLILLGPSIVQNFTVHYPRLFPNIVSMHHPYIFSNIRTKVRTTNSVLKFGWVGVATEAKGFPIFDKMTRHFSNEYPNRFSAHFVGWHPFSFDSYPQITFTSQAHEFLDRSVFDQAVSDLDYILFFYSNAQYRYTASGAIFDAIEHGKLIIALRNDYFEAIFEACGAIGFLCDSIEDMYHIVEQLLREEIKVDQFYANLQKARKIFSCAHIKLTV
ncbi:hypothetical protein [Sphingobacterium kitahiroshimense]|uniref:hypothetical protein n=1 Tax=Sphingobacterium kitahiroshimense TaxID=470446 RepID=UPI003208014C